jgi:hypothetical protein
VFAAVTGPLGVLFALAMVGAAGWGLWWLWHWWRRKNPPRPRGLLDHPNRRKILNAYRRAERKARAPRGAAQTVGEHVRAAPALTGLEDAVNIAAYRPSPPDADMVEAIKRL